MLSRRDLLKTATLLPFIPLPKLEASLSPLPKLKTIEAMIYTEDFPTNRSEWKIYKAKDYDDLWDIYHDGQFYYDTINKFPSIANDHFDPAKQGKTHCHIRIWLLNPNYPSDLFPEYYKPDSFKHKWPHLEWEKRYNGFCPALNLVDFPQNYASDFFKSVKQHEHFRDLFL